MRPIGDQELALLRDLSERGAATVAEVVERFGQPRGLARSTVLTMMERLRKKGHLTRRQVAGIYRYQPRTAPGDAVQHAVASFVDRTLGGSVTPFVTFLAEAHQVSDQELAELEELVARLQDERRRSS
jgi:predicted transcriptional regulator